MKISVNKKPAGVVLLVALFVIVTSGVVIAGYLTLMQGEKKSVARSQTWNNCVPIMEAGVEEAMAQIHYCGNTTNFSSNSWTMTNGYYQKMRNMGTDGTYCVIQIQPATPPIIYATAYVPVPATATNYVTRKVKVATKSPVPGSGGLTAKGDITFGNNNVFDSYNSSVAPYSSSTAGTNAMALTDSSDKPAITVGGGTIDGIAVTGPGGTVQNNGGTITGGTASDANVQINSISAPNTSGWNSYSSLLTSLLNGTTYSPLVTAGKYYNTGDLSLSSQNVMGIFGNVTLYVTGNFSISGQASIYIAPNSSLTLYVGGPTITVAGNGIVNATQNAANLTVYGLTTCTNVQMAGNGAFYGQIDAPQSTLTVTGNGDMFGAFTAGAIQLKGNGAVHYDQALAAFTGFVMASWNEL